MSFAGSLRVNVTHRKLLNDLDTNWQSSTTTTSGTEFHRSPRPGESAAPDCLDRAVDVPRDLNCQNPRHDKLRVPEGVWQMQISWNLGRQFADRLPRRGNHDLGAPVESVPAVVERVDCRAGVKVQVASPVNATEQVPKEPADVRACWRFHHRND